MARRGSPGAASRYHRGRSNKGACRRRAPKRRRRQPLSVSAVTEAHPCRVPTACRLAIGRLVPASCRRERSDTARRQDRGFRRRRRPTSRSGGRVPRDDASTSGRRRCLRRGLPSRPRTQLRRRREARGSREGLPTGARSTSALRPYYGNSACLDPGDNRLPGDHQRADIARPERPLRRLCPPPAANTREARKRAPRVTGVSRDMDAWLLRSRVDRARCDGERLHGRAVKTTGAPAPTAVL